MKQIESHIPCYHCGDPCERTALHFDGKDFCCNGCRTVYEIFQGHGLESYYEIQAAAGSSPRAIANKFDFLDNQEVVSKLLDFNEDGVQVVRFHIPQMHCSSCIWVLENLNRLHPDIKGSQVDFPKRKVRITYESQKFQVKDLALLLASIGYEPSISLEDYATSKKKVDRQLIYKLGVAGFAFGNVMLLSFPEYFEVREFWLDQYKPFFRWLMFCFSLPVVFYASQDYFKAAYKGLRSKVLNIDVPIALGILTLFLRSTAVNTLRALEGSYHNQNAVATVAMVKTIRVKRCPMASVSVWNALALFFLKAELPHNWVR